MTRLLGCLLSVAALALPVSVRPALAFTGGCALPGTLVLDPGLKPTESTSGTLTAATTAECGGEPSLMTGSADWRGTYSGSLLTGSMEGTMVGAVNTSFNVTWVEQVALVTTTGGDCTGIGVGSLVPTGPVGIGGSVTDLLLDVSLGCV